MDEDAFVVKYDAEGNVQWAKAAGGTSQNSSPSDFGAGLATDAAGNLFVTGRFGGPATFGEITLSTGGMFIARFGATLLPLITSQPRSQTVLFGSRVAFTVAAVGGTTYQWEHEGAPIGGATGTALTLVAPEELRALEALQRSFGPELDARGAE